MTSEHFGTAIVDEPELKIRFAEIEPVAEPVAEPVEPVEPAEPAVLVVFVVLVVLVVLFSVLVLGYPRIQGNAFEVSSTEVLVITDLLSNFYSLIYSVYLKICPCSRLFLL